ncbi:MAG: hypoxanthine phosphoribosyltransferase [Acidobacteriota bacterium]
MPADVTPLITADQIRQRISELAREIRADAPDAALHFIGVLKGSVFFLADLLRAMPGTVTMDFIAVASYAGSKSSGEVRLLKDVDRGLQDRHVIVVEDIVDTGLTLHYLQDILRARGPASLRTACLLSKPSRRKIDVPVDYVGFTIEDQFVVGYGLDYDEQHRHLPYIGVLTV